MEFVERRIRRDGKKISKRLILKRNLTRFLPRLERGWCDDNCWCWRMGTRNQYGHCLRDRKDQETNRTSMMKERLTLWEDRRHFRSGRDDVSIDWRSELLSHSSVGCSRRATGCSKQCNESFKGKQQSYTLVEHLHCYLLSPTIVERYFRGQKLISDAFSCTLVSPLCHMCLRCRTRRCQKSWVAGPEEHSNRRPKVRECCWIQPIRR